MMSKYKLVRSIQYLIKQMGLLLQLVSRQTVSLLARVRKIITRRTKLENSGFVLPTVTMVMLVVVLLSIAMLLRSFDRAEVARNVRIDQATLAAATPALDRAKAKIEEMFNDSGLPRATPRDYALYQVIGEKASTRYRFGDERGEDLEGEIPRKGEIPLKIAFDFNGTDKIQANDDTEDPNDLKLEDNEETKTAWMFPVDTDNNGEYDTYTLYSILFRSPSRNSDGQFERTRNPLEARTLPMPEAKTISNRCQNAFGTTASIVGDSDWYKQSSQLSKSFFVYTISVPITEEIMEDLSDNNYEEKKGETALSALEYQQDRLRIPLSNNAVWFEDDLELGSVSNFRLNGRVLTNGNLMTRAGYNGPITFYQVSDPDSCYYEAENGKILVGGNVANGDVTHSGSIEGGRKEVIVHKYKQDNEPDKDDKINAENITINQQGGAKVGYDVNAYNEKIGKLVTKYLEEEPDAPGVECEYCKDKPEAVKDSYKLRADPGEDNKDLLKDVLKSYYRSITPKISFGGSIDTVEKFEDINTVGNIAYLPTSDPEETDASQEESLIGDRISVGYGLPAIDEETGQKKEDSFPDDIKWNKPGEENQPSDNTRTRKTQIEFIPNLGATGRGLFWEKEAAKIPEEFENSGGLRVVTGAGIYLPDDYFTNGTKNLANWDNVWSDALPMALDTTTKSIKSDINIILGASPNLVPYLRMRATAVYHYAEVSTREPENPANTAQTPFACVSSYYDPTDATSALNQSGLPYFSNKSGYSNNGIVYNYVPVSKSDPRLTVQAELKYPSGRYVNLPLKTALDRETEGDPLRLQDYSAIHAAQCALHILDDSTDYSTAIPHGVIKEATFLDAREVKSLNRLSTSKTNKLKWLEIAELENLQPNAKEPSENPTRYNLPLEQRQPLEIRVTQIDLSQLRGTNAKIGTNEYLLPNSGIIYATRDDALPDISAVDATTGDINKPTAEEEMLSTSDFKLDPSRRPNGIRLINGTNLSRTDANDGDVVVEKGFIFVSNLPVYIKAAVEDGIPGFNLHKKPGAGTLREEFNDALEADWSNFYTRGNSDFNPGFACRTSQASCQDGGDQWRPATVIADSITLLSYDWEDGYRNLGDYDLRNNLGNSVASDFLNNGFLFNNFVTSSDWADANGWPNTNHMNSYLANGVTPIQRRVKFPEYLMEVCKKLPVSECGYDDWFVDPDLKLKASDTTVIGSSFTSSKHKAGTTARPADAAYQRYPRRVAFFRNSRNELSSNGTAPITNAEDLVPIGIDGGTGTAGKITGGTIVKKPLSGAPPTSVAGSLWFHTTSDKDNPTDSSKITYNDIDPLFIKQMPIDSSGTYDAKGQPLLAPMLEIHSATGTPNNNHDTVFGKNKKKDTALQRRWLQVADDGYNVPKNSRQTFYNAAFVGGNTPSRPDPGETGGGLHNFVRTLEMWGDPEIKDIPQRTINIRGNFIQSGQTKYATAPMQPADKDQNTAAGLFYELKRGQADYRYDKDDKGFPYRGGGFLQQSPFYWPSQRAWGFDVAILSQAPDLFAQRFTGDPVDGPDEYFREISSDDEWIQVLLCAKRQDDEKLALKGSVRPSDWCEKNSYSE